MKNFSAIKALPFVFTIILTLQPYGCEGCLDKERKGLLELKSNLITLIGVENVRVNFLSSWSDNQSSSDCCHWERIKCNTSTRRVIDLSLDNLVPESVRFLLGSDRTLNLSLLHSFEELQTFDFSHNWFLRLIVHTEGFRSFERLKNLRFLNFSYNRFNNSILPFLSQAVSLRVLDLEDNHIEGVFPPKELAGMSALKVLNLNQNMLRFVSTQDLMNFGELEVLKLSSNHLNDSDAGQGFSYLIKLQTLDLSHNDFSNFSQIQGISKMTKLRTLDLSDNNFPDLFQLQGLTYLRELKVLRVRYSHLDNTFLARQVLASLTNLQSLDLSYNTFSNFSHVQDLANLRHLRALILRGNKFAGSLTNQVFANMTKLEVLDLSDNLFSVIPQIQGASGICGLTDLRELDLSGNAFIGLPYCLGNLTRLRTLDLASNLLSGFMPAFLSNLSSLEYLSLVQNNFKGSFSFSSLTNQSSLKVFRVSSNRTIHIQTESSWIPPFQLKRLQLQNCNLSGPLPAFLLHQHDLRVIDLSDNKLVGAFSSWLLQNNTDLKSLFLRNNFLTELRLPTLVHGLYNLDISNNRIVGSLHESIGNFFPNLTTMNVSNNGFKGGIPSSMGWMKKLWLLDASYNSFSGQLPRDFLSGCHLLQVLKLTNNTFQGQIFPEYSNMVVLYMLFLDSNNFTGFDIGLLKSNFSLAYLDISNNMLSGKIPSWIAGFSRLSCLWMKGTHIEGPFPHQLQNLTQLVLLDISDNRLSGLIPKNVNLFSLRDLNMQNNGFVGSIPDALFESTELQVLDLRNNKLSGEIPKSIGKTSRLSVLLLRKNHLQGHIPEEICQLRDINVLDLSYNRLSGFIPSCLNNMSFGMLEDVELRTPYAIDPGYGGLWWLETENFYMSGLTLDEESDENSYKFQPLVTVEFAMKSRYDSFQDKIIPYLFGLDLSVNEFSGGIPVQVGDLQNILSLNLSHNRLIGSIPEKISNLKNIESLDLSCNRLNASIPTQLAELNNLGYFNVSYNNLSGPIPFIGHHTTFDEKSYMGNANLCGKPTNKSCDSAEEPNSSAAQLDEREDDGAVIDMVWFYWSLGASYITVLLGLFAFLCIDSRWSREWFYRVDLCVYHLQRLKHVSIFK